MRPRSDQRAVRVLMVANDGFSAGHVARAAAIAGGLRRAAVGRGLTVQTVLATTSSAEPLLRDAAATVVRLPSPEAGRRGGLGDVERRSLVRGAIQGVVAGFAPDVLVVDTFPSGPHGELAGVRVPRRVLVRRATAAQGELPPGLDGALTAGLEAYDLAVLAGDPGPIEPMGMAELDVKHVAPIARIDEALGRDEARARLGVDEALGRDGVRGKLGVGDALEGDGARGGRDEVRPRFGTEGRVFLVASGGGGDRGALDRARSIARSIVRISPNARVVFALGPLTGDVRFDEPRIRAMRIAPLSAVMRAFDGGFAPAGYNTAHELAALGVPAALFAQPRTFDDQAARASRFASGGWACALTGFDDDAIAAALAWMTTARVPVLRAGGELEAADAVLELIAGGAS